MSHSLCIQSSSTTWQTGEDTVIRAQFINNGTLLNTGDTNFRAINDKWPCYGFAHDLGNITDASTAVFVIGQARDPVVNYITSGGSMQARSALYLSQYSSINDAVRVDPATVHRPCLIVHLAQITTFAKDYDNALSRADALDLQITQDATAISGNYSEIVSLSVRQTLGALEFTYTPGNSSDVMAFVKGTLIFLSACSSADSVRHSIRDQQLGGEHARCARCRRSCHGLNMYVQSISTTDVIYPAWPLFLYTNPAIGKALLLPLLEYQATGQYPNKWAVHDLGAWLTHLTHPPRVLNAD